MMDWLWIGPVCSYLDPGSGSMLFQFLISGLVTSVFALKLYWNNLRSIFRRRTKKEF